MMSGFPGRRGGNWIFMKKSNGKMQAELVNFGF